MNAGDLFHEHAFRVASQVMNHEGVNWICGYHLKINEAGEVIAVSKPPRYRREFIMNGTYLRGFPYDGIQQEGIFFRRRLLETVDLESLKAFRRSGDYFLWTQLAKHTELHTVLSFLGAFRLHEGQLTFRVEKGESGEEIGSLPERGENLHETRDISRKTHSLLGIPHPALSQRCVVEFHSRTISSQNFSLR